MKYILNALQLKANTKKKKIRLQVKILDFRKIGYLFRRASQFPD